MSAPSVVDYFSGCGGTSLGLQQAGLKIVAGIDVDPDAANTYRLNFPAAAFFERDIVDLDPEEVRSVIPPVGPIVFSGCAPCQPFSKQNRLRRKVDPRRNLLDFFGYHIAELLPDFVVVENVPGLQRLSERGPLARFMADLTELGYSATHRVIAAADYGVPQIRKRLVILASRGYVIDFPAPTHGAGRQSYSTVRDWIFDLPALSAGAADVADPDHTAMSLSSLNKSRIAMTLEGGGRESWPEELWADCHKTHSGHTDAYGRMAWDRPASGLTTRCLSYSNGRFGHPVQDRAISLREAACLQTFPRSFSFSGTLTSRGRQVGNAVPPLLASRIGAEILAACRLPRV